MCYRYREDIENHPEALDLRFLCAQSYLALDLVDQTIEELKKLQKIKKRKFQGGMWKKRDGYAQVMLYLARAYRQTGDPDYVYATLVRFQQKFGRYIPEEITAPEEVAVMDVNDLQVGRDAMGLNRRLRSIRAALKADLSKDVTKILGRK